MNASPVRARRRLRQARVPPRAIPSRDPVMTARLVNVHYGDKHAVRNVSLDIGRNQVLALIGPSGCGKSTFLRCLNRMNDTIPSARVTAAITLDGQDIYDRSRTWRSCGRASAWCSRSPLRSRTRSMTTSPTGRAFTGWRRAARDWTSSCARSLQRAGLWDEVKDRLSQPGHRALRRPAAAAVHRAHHRRATRRSSSWTSRPRRSTRSPARGSRI